MTAEPIRLLLLEDNPGDARLVQTALADHAPGGFSVTWVERLAEALARIQTEKFDAALCDLGLPDSTGLATAQAIAARSPGLPLVVLTGSHNEDLGRAAIQRGAQDYLVKGEAEGAIIARTLRYAIERKRLELALRMTNEVLEGRVAERTVELRDALEKLSRSETRFRELTELASDWYWEQDEEFRFTWLSRELTDITGIPNAELIGHSRWERHPGDVTEDGWAEHRRMLVAHEAFRDFEYRHADRDGNARYVSISGGPVFDGEQRFRGYRGVGRDITARKRSELALARQKDLYAALSQTNEAIVRCSGRAELFEAICRIAVDYGRFRFAWIGMIDPADRMVKLVAKYGADLGYLDQLRMSVNDADAASHSVTGQALREGRRGVSNDFLSDPVTAPWHEAAQQAGVRAFAAFPIRQGGAVAGAISMYADEPGFFTGELLATLDDMAGDVSFALDNLARESERRHAVEALQESEARYRSLFENMLNGLAYCRMLYDAAGRPVDWVYLEVNDAFRRLTGLKEVVAKRVTDVIPGIRAGNPGLFDIYGRVASTGAPETFEIDLKALNKWFHVSAYCPAKDHFVAVFEDISARRKAEQELRESEEHHRLLFESSRDALMTLAPPSWRFTDANQATLDLFGAATVHAFTDLGPLDVAPERQPDGRPSKEKAQEMIAAAMREGKNLFEWENQRLDGSRFFADVLLTRMDLRGESFLHATVRDITARKHAERQLADAEARFRSLVEQSFTGIFIIQQGKFAYVNPRFVEIMGYGSDTELLGLDPVSITAEKDIAHAQDTMRRLIEGTEKHIRHSLAARRKDGSTVDLGLQSAHANYLGQPAILGMMQDISEKKRAEEQIQNYVAQLKVAFMQTVEVATTLSEMRDPYTAGHERRVAEIAVAIAGGMGLDADRIEGLRVAGYLHDIGKITIPAEILSKPGKLSAVEFSLIKGHSQASYDAVKNVEFPWPVADMVLQHHERMDGSGYPNGLKGEAILVEARILAVADTVEAMSSHRPYRPGLGIDKALAEIERGRASIYDGEVADACLRLFREQGYRLPE